MKASAIRILSALLVGAILLPIVGGCSSGDVTTDDVKSKEAQIDEASKKLPPSDTHPEGDERERGG